MYYLHDLVFYSPQWDAGSIVQMGWSVTEDLLCVADDGTVLVYDIHGAIKKTLTMGQVGNMKMIFVSTTVVYIFSIQCTYSITCTFHDHFK